MREILPLAAVDWAAMIGLMVNIPEGPSRYAMALR
jgi:hypothetical protein